MDRGFPKDAQLTVNLIATVNQVLDILHVRLVCRIIKILEHTPDKFVFADFQGPF